MANPSYWYTRTIDEELCISVMCEKCNEKTTEKTWRWDKNYPVDREIICSLCNEIINKKEQGENV